MYSHIILHMLVFLSYLNINISFLLRVFLADIGYSEIRENSEAPD